MICTTLLRVSSVIRDKKTAPGGLSQAPMKGGAGKNECKIISYFIRFYLSRQTAYSSIISLRNPAERH